MQRAMPFVLVILKQIGVAGMDILTKAVLNEGMSSYVLGVYRHGLATIIMAPFGFYFDRYIVYSTFLSQNIIYSNIIRKRGGDRKSLCPIKNFLHTKRKNQKLSRVSSLSRLRLSRDVRLSALLIFPPSPLSLLSPPKAYFLPLRELLVYMAAVSGVRLRWSLWCGEDPR